MELRRFSTKKGSVLGILCLDCMGDILFDKLYKQ